MAYKLAVGSVVEFESVVKLNDGGRIRTFPLRLQGRRLGHEELGEKTRAMTDRALLLDVITGWQQKLLLDDASGEPVPYSAEAFEAMLSMVLNLEHQLARAYVEASWDRKAAQLGN